MWLAPVLGLLSEVAGDNSQTAQYYGAAGVILLGGGVITWLLKDRAMTQHEFKSYREKKELEFERLNDKREEQMFELYQQQSQLLYRVSKYIERSSTTSSKAVEAVASSRADREGFKDMADRMRRMVSELESRWDEDS